MSLSRVKIGTLDDFPRFKLSHTPTPIDEMPNLGKLIGRADLYAKRDDCTGLGMGGNKARQLEFYIGDALLQGADTILITGAVQSNFLRMAAAAARKAGMDCHIQLEERVENPSAIYRRSGNVLLSKLCGAELHSFPEGENEEGADRRLNEIADELRNKGRNPYIIYLGQGHPPLGALGYVIAARELVGQFNETDTVINEIVVASGSGATHAGLLFGLRVLGCPCHVKGICVRRTAERQRPRIIRRCEEIADLLELDNPVVDKDVDINDDFLAPGYGRTNDAVLEAIKLTARSEGIILDPVYTGRVMAGFLNLARRAEIGQGLLFLHTGGQPAVFGYESELQPLLGSSPF